MTNASPPSQKKCPSCGLIKPLAAFLVLQPTLTGSQYAAICNSCRNKSQLKPKAEHDEGESETVYSEHQIDNKSKFATDVERKLQYKTQEELDAEIIKEQEKAKELKLDKKAEALKQERRHRFDYLAKNPLQEKKREERKPAKTPLSSEYHRIKKQVEAQHGERLHEQEKQVEQQKEIDEINVINPLHQAGPQIKFNSTVFQQFKAWLGGDNVPAVRNLEEAAKISKESDKPAEKEKANPTVVEYIKRNFTKP